MIQTSLNRTIAVSQACDKVNHSAGTCSRRVVIGFPCLCSLEYSQVRRKTPTQNKKEGTEACRCTLKVYGGVQLHGSEAKYKIYNQNGKVTSLNTISASAAVHLRYSNSRILVCGAKRTTRSCEISREMMNTILARSFALCKCGARNHLT